MRQPAYSARAGRSDGHEEGRVDLVMEEEARERMRRRFHMCGVCGSHERIVERCDAGNNALLCQGTEPVERKDDIPVVLEAGAVKVGRDMAHDQVIHGTGAREDEVVPSDGTAGAGGDRKRAVVTAGEGPRSEKGGHPPG